MAHTLLYEAGGETLDHKRRTPLPRAGSDLEEHTTCAGPKCGGGGGYLGESICAFTPSQNAP